MGVYAETTAEITCDSNKVAKQVAKVLKAQTKKSDEHGNDFAQEIEVGGEQVFFKANSGRIQNLEYRCEEIWKAIKNIKGVIEMNCPFMAESDGSYFSQEEGHIGQDN